MEGVMDGVMREIITNQNDPVHGGYDQAVTEFIRVTDQVLPETTFYKYCPELRNNCLTSSGTPVFVQLLGGDPVKLAENAQKAADLGAIGIDLNFGCPAATVNRHDGGATLLKYPDRIYEIIKQVRAAVPKAIPVTAKIRLGFENHDDCLLNVVRIQDAGADWVTVHCRTKKELYQPLIHWNYIQKIANLISIPIVVNGEIWTINDIDRCKEQTKQEVFMIGRGSMVNPFLASEVKTKLSINSQVSHIDEKTWMIRYIDLLNVFALKSLAERGNKCTVKKLKQWIRMTSLKNPTIQILFDQVKTQEETTKIQELSRIFLDFCLNEIENKKNEAHIQNIIHPKETSNVRCQNHYQNTLSLL
ncbi:MAG: tRNA dihydrouridine synthase [Pseudobdellovibrionaceae bacterium]